MQNIPIKLKNCKFLRVLKKTKKPFEKDWTNKPYSYEEIHKHFPNENYGVMTGHNELGVLDDDSKNKILMELYYKHFPRTFLSHSHLYIKLKGWDSKKIILHDLEGNHVGELQGMGQMVVGCGSQHPDGHFYELKEDIPIVEIEFEKFKEVFKNYIKKEAVKNNYSSIMISNWSGDDIKSIPIGSIINLSKLEDAGNGNYQGSHPTHGSNGGMNFRVDTNNNTWYCFRCRSGGGPSELIGVVENIIQCDRAGRNCYSTFDAQQVIKIARKKYGLKSPDILDTFEPQGWALSINIIEAAKKRNFLNCPSCKMSFEFNERLGFFRCPHDTKWKGVKKFLELYIKTRDQTI